MADLTEKYCGANGYAGEYYNSLPKGNEIFSHQTKTRQRDKPALTKEVIDAREIIVENFGSVKSFCNECHLPFMIVDDILKKGITNAIEKRQFEKITILLEGYYEY